MIQTESPYYQPTPNPPAPFANVVGKFSGDPDYTCASGNDFSGCDQSWSTIITGSENIFIAAAGLYSVSSDSVFTETHKECAAVSSLTFLTIIPPSRLTNTLVVVLNLHTNLHRHSAMPEGAHASYCQRTWRAINECDHHRREVHGRHGRQRHIGR